MRLFDLARTPPRWLRALLVSLVLVLARDSLGHVLHTHGHDYDSRPGVDSALCGYCVAFDRMVDGPTATAFAVVPAELVAHPVELESAVPALRPVLRFVPRGPPAA
jgi:hypothetical protein